MKPLSELLSLTEVAFVHDLSRYADDLQIYFRQDWTADKFFALRKHNILSLNNLKFLIMLSDGLNYTTLNRMDNPRLVLSFRKRASDDMGFVIVSIDKKGW